MAQRMPDAAGFSPTFRGIMPDRDPHHGEAFSLLAQSGSQLDKVSRRPGPNLAPETNPAMVEIGEERGSVGVAGQRADAASSWNTLEGGV